MGRRRRKTEIGGGAGGVLFRGVHPMKLAGLGENVFTGIEDTVRMEKSNSNRRVRFGPSLSYLYEDAGRDIGRSSRFGGEVA